MVIVTFNSAAVVERLIASLDSGLEGTRWRAVVVDNASTDGTADAVAASGVEVIRRTENAGYAAAINDGARRLSTARSTLILNPDCSLEPRAGTALLRVLESDERVGVVAPKTLTDEDPPTLDPTLRREPSLSRLWVSVLVGGRRGGPGRWAADAVVDAASYDAEHDADWAVGAALLAGRRCQDAVGDWDESFFLYSEEVDFCRRVRAAGFKVRYTPDAVVHHLGGEGQTDPRLRAMMVVNRVRDYARHHGTLRSWAYLAGSLLFELTRAVRRPASRTAALALAIPGRRPPELGASTSFVPR